SSSHSFSSLFSVLLGLQFLPMALPQRLIFFARPAVAVLENGGIQCVYQPAMGIDWHVGLAKVTRDDGTEKLRVTVRGTNSNKNSTATTWRASIQSMVSIYDRWNEPTREKSLSDAHGRLNIFIRLAVFECSFKTVITRDRKYMSDDRQTIISK
ncbi:hypothetical protein PRIPAC_71574, partial [Pristionchus pacificus]|uniref:Uncharacterized protein n=1 Tax=Pristionchus pacificus TaxID=54126 RepID=A0A2A6CG85_PRIPA